MNNNSDLNTVRPNNYKMEYDGKPLTTWQGVAVFVGVIVSAIIAVAGVIQISQWIFWLTR